MGNSSCQLSAGRSELSCSSTSSIGAVNTSQQLTQQPQLRHQQQQQKQHPGLLVQGSGSAPGPVKSRLSTSGSGCISSITTNNAPAPLAASPGAAAGAGAGRLLGPGTEAPSSSIGSICYPLQQAGFSELGKTTSQSRMSHSAGSNSSRSSGSAVGCSSAGSSRASSRQNSAAGKSSSVYLTELEDEFAEAASVTALPSRELKLIPSGNEAACDISQVAACPSNVEGEGVMEGLQAGTAGAAAAGGGEDQGAAAAQSWVQQVEGVLQQLDCVPVSGSASDAAVIMSSCAGVQGLLDVAEGQGQLER